MDSERESSDDFGGSRGNSEEVFVGSGRAGERFGEPGADTLLTSEFAREINDAGATAFGERKIGFGECGRAGKENAPGFRETVLFDGLDDGRLAASFGKGASDRFFIYETEIGCSEAAFFEQRLQLCTEKRGSASDDYAARFEGSGHGLRGDGARNHAVPEVADQVQHHAGDGISTGDDEQSDFGKIPDDGQQK